MENKIFDKISNKLTSWNGGSYSDKNDSSIMVPKELPGSGWTINWGNPKAVKLLILTFVVMIAIIIGFCLFFA